MAQKPVYTYVSVYGITACLPARVPLLTASVAGLFIFSHIIYIPLSPFAGSLARDRRARRTHRVLYNRQKVLHFCVYILYIFGYLASRAIYLFLHLRRRPEYHRYMKRWSISAIFFLFFSALFWKMKLWRILGEFITHSLKIFKLHHVLGFHWGINSGNHLRLSMN